MEDIDLSSMLEQNIWFLSNSLLCYSHYTYVHLVPMVFMYSRYMLTLTRKFQMARNADSWNLFSRCQSVSEENHIFFEWGKNTKHNLKTKKLM